LILYVLGTICLVLALLLGVVCHPAIFFGGRPIAGPMGAFYDLFWWGQWTAFCLTAAAILLFFGVWKFSPTLVGTTFGRMWILPTVSVLLLLYLLAAGVPHSANRFDWYKGKLGVIEFIRAAVRR
jgi:hypothetical protein